MKVIRSTGPDRALVMVVAERPGREEQSRGRVLCGPSGQELDRFLLTESGIDRATVRCCNIVHDYRDGENPEPWEVYRDWPLFMEEIQRCRPRFVALVGLWSARAVLGPDIDMEVFGGLAFPYSTCTSCGQIYPKGFEPSEGIKKWLLDLDKSYSEGWVGQQDKEAALHVRQGTARKDSSVPLLRTGWKSDSGETTASQVRKRIVRKSQASGTTNSVAASQETQETEVLSRTQTTSEAQRQVSQMSPDSNEEVEYRKLFTEARIQQAMETRTLGPCSCSKSGVQKTTLISFMPIIHPSATLHQPKYAARCASDFRQLGKLVRGDSLPSGHLRPPQRVSYSDGILPLTDCDVIAMDTEGTVARPWGLSYSVRAGQASVQHRRKHRNWNCPSVNNATVVLHNAMADLPVLRKLGVRPRRWEDTMLKAALLGTEPLSLKALARRHCGMVMDEYSEIVAEARRDKALEFLDRVVEWCNREVAQ